MLAISVLYGWKKKKYTLYAEEEIFQIDIPF